MAVLQTIIIGIGFLFSMPVQAGVKGDRVFEADMGDVRWEAKIDPMDNPDTLSCELVHQIPGFGQAVFRHQAGRDIEFFVHPKKAPKSIKNARLYAKEAPWYADTQLRSLGTLPIQTQGKYFYATDDLVWRMLNELDNGHMPTLVFNDSIYGGESVEVRFPTLHFNAAYLEWLECEHKLLPIAFDDINMTQIHFKFDRFDITPDELERLEKVRRYVLSDGRIKKIVLEAHTDSKGKLYYNELLATRRAEAVKNYLTKAGVAESLFAVEIFGELRPIANNNSDMGRGHNRRVIIRLRKD